MHARWTGTLNYLFSRQQITDIKKYRSGFLSISFSNPERKFVCVFLLVSCHPECSADLPEQFIIELLAQH